MKNIENEERKKYMLNGIIPFVFLISYLLLFEKLSQDAFRKSCLEIFWTWLGDGNMWGLILFFWVLTTLCWIGFCSTHVHTIYLAIVGKIQSYIFLGDKLSEGEMVVREDDKTRSIQFAPAYLAKQQPNFSFNKIYTRAYYLENPKGGITHESNFRLGKNLVWSFVQIVMLGFSLACVNEMLEHFAHVKSVTLHTKIDPLLFILAYFFLMYPIGLTVLWASSRNIKHGGEPVLLLPPEVHPGATLKAKIIATDLESPPTNNKKLSPKITYKRFLLEFRDPDIFKLPVYVTWYTRRYSDNNISVYRGTKKQKMLALKNSLDALFVKLEEAIKTEELISCTLDVDLCPIPQISGYDVLHLYEKDAEENDDD
ncbi:MAG: hypothetical protein O9302_12000 [Cyclobacteriaceae bacterium]|nr:hypothetical protein [Cytophagales bacterium]MCZ8328778.1 hypothetical protein [Cyclobacteriaceae bacterium]